MRRRASERFAWLTRSGIEQQIPHAACEKARVRNDTLHVLVAFIMSFGMTRSFFGCGYFLAEVNGRMAIGWNGTLGDCLMEEWLAR